MWDLQRINDARWESQCWWQQPEWIVSCTAIMHRAALTLAQLHRQGLILRDFKPAHVYVATASPAYMAADAPVYLLDMGNAYVPGQKASIAGTPLYMSPEQLWERNDLLSFRSDLYSFGATFFNLLHHAFAIYRSARDGFDQMLKLRNALQSGTRPIVSPQLHREFPKLAEFVLACLQVRPVPDFFTRWGAGPNHLRSDAPWPDAGAMAADLGQIVVGM